MARSIFPQRSHVLYGITDLTEKPSTRRLVSVWMIHLWVKRQVFMGFPGASNKTGKGPHADDIDVPHREMVGLRVGRFAVDLRIHHVDHANRMHWIRVRRFLNMNVTRGQTELS